MKHKNLIMAMQCLQVSLLFLIIDILRPHITAKLATSILLICAVYYWFHERITNYIQNLKKGVKKVPSIIE